MSDAITVKDRQSVGKRNNRRMRAAGEVPAVLYGHGADNVNLSVATDAIVSALRHGTKMVDLTGAVRESALISDVQWDTFGRDVLHVDLVRVSKDERIEVEVALETRGVAPGVSEGGTVEVLLHALTIECPAGSIPENLEININELALGGSIDAEAIELPAGAKLITDAATTVVQCIEVAEVDEEEEVGAAATAEPEVIGRAPDEEEAAGE
ncbi:MAG: 50S ribosomal protein L25 [Pirellulales bacterium]|nr:50S ribosomal protein L25 [Pirellulales bacterium]